MTSFSNPVLTEPSEIQQRWLAMLASTTHEQKHTLTTINDDSLITELFALEGLLAGGLHVVISPTVNRIKYHLHQLKPKLSLQTHTPFVAELDRSTLPHEERDIYQKIDRGQVQLLFVTPSKFATLDFLSLLAHQNVAWIMIEKAHLLLGDFEGSESYAPIPKALAQFQKIPPLVIMTQSLPPVREKQLLETLNIIPAERFYWTNTQATENFPSRINVYPVLTEQQKLRRLLPQLPPKNIFENEPKNTETLTIISTRFQKNAQKLIKTLHHHGWTQALPYLESQTFAEKKSLLQHIQNENNPLVITQGIIDVPITSQHPHQKIIFWQPPSNLELALNQVLQEKNPSEMAFLYTKEDYQTLMQWFNNNTNNPPQKISTQKSALNRYRHWVKSKHCRQQTLIAYLAGTRKVSSSPCGHCDRCKKGFPYYRELLEALFL